MSDSEITPEPLQVVGLFAGIGGLELGLHRGLGTETKLLCEWWEPAQAVLRDRFPFVPLHDDVQTLSDLPEADTASTLWPAYSATWAQGRQTDAWNISQHDLLRGRSDLCISDRDLRDQSSLHCA